MLKYADLFAGIGGFRLGFDRLGHECIFSSDIDKNAAATYELNFKENPLNDITRTDSKEIPDFDILTAGFPCQPFSIAGHRKGFRDTRTKLLIHICKCSRCMDWNIRITFKCYNKSNPKTFKLRVK